MTERWTKNKTVIFVYLYRCSLLPGLVFNSNNRKWRAGKWKKWVTRKQKTLSRHPSPFHPSDWMHKRFHSESWPRAHHGVQCTHYAYTGCGVKDSRVSNDRRRVIGPIRLYRFITLYYWAIEKVFIRHHVNVIKWTTRIRFWGIFQKRMCCLISLR